MRITPRRGLPVCLLAIALSGCDEPSFESCTVVSLHPPAAGAPVALRTVDDPRVHIAFVPEGFRAEDLDRAERRARRLLEGVLADRTSMLGRVPDHLAATFVPLASATGGLRNGDPLDTALGNCQLFDDADPDGKPAVSLEAVDAAIAQALPDVVPDVVVVLVDTPGRANAPGHRVLMPSDADADTLVHELGHALLGLGDEYSTADQRDVCYAAGEAPGPLDPFTEPNLTLDPDGAKWAALVDGAKAGGFGVGRCVFHPPGKCRMHDSQTRGWCPVCAREVDRWVAAVLGNDDGPRCELALIEASPPLSVRCVDDEGQSTLTTLEVTADPIVLSPRP